VFVSDLKHQCNEFLPLTYRSSSWRCMALHVTLDQQPGTFLLRLSSHAGIFTVSVVTRKGVEHKRILYKATSDFGAPLLLLLSSAITYHHHRY
jgi:hypothetical protein